MGCLVPRIRTWAVILLASLWLSATWVTLALAQVGGDDDGPDSDELAGLPLVLGVGLWPLLDT
jgi:hypothetical protein